MSNDITDYVLENDSKGVDEETHNGKFCCPKMKIGTYYEGNKEIGSMKFFFRNCKCGKFKKKKCSALLKQFYSSGGISLPTDGVDIHRDDAGCYYDEPILQIDNNSQWTYIYSCQCFCKKLLSRTAHIRR